MRAPAAKATIARRAGIVQAFACVALLMGGAASAQQPVLSGEQIEAAFIYNFTKFVEWPESVFTSKTQPIVIGVLGASALTSELTTIVEGRKVNGRPIVVRDVVDHGDVELTNVLFVGETEDERFAAMEPIISDRPILTIGETDVFAAAGGAFRFVGHNGKLRFEINMASVEQSGLKVSGELQKLATAVRREP